MNTSKLKNYAPAARTALIEAVTRRAGLLVIQPSRVEDVTEAEDVALIGGQPFQRSNVRLRKRLLERIKAEGFTRLWRPRPTLGSIAPASWRALNGGAMQLRDGSSSHS